MKQRACLLSLILILASFAAAAATEPPPPWAYGFKEPPPPGTAQAPPASAGPTSTDPTAYGLPGTGRKFTRAEITNIFEPADYFPGDHPVPPAIVAHGKPPAVWSCARCHYFNGKGRPENAGISGLPVDYFMEQMLAFRNGERLSSDPRKANTPLMAEFARAMSDEDIRAAAEYFGSMKWTPWIRVVEVARVPKTTISAGMYLPVPDGGDESIGDRIIEVPADAEAVELQRNPRAGFIAYVPPGSSKRGEALVTTGAGKTLPCTACHGPDLKGQTLAGFGSMPGLAGRSPSYLVRQMFDIKSGKRTGKRLELMMPVVAALSSDDMRDIAAYLASRKP
jgi:cytochrome c553